MSFKQYITFCITILVTIVQTISAEDNDTITHKKIIHKLGFDIASGYIFPTHRFLKGVNYKEKPMHTCVSANLKYGFQFGEDTYFGRNYPHTTQGIGVSYNTFFNKKELGNPIAIYAFQGSRIASLSDKLSLDYEWNLGASFGWKKYDERTNPNNKLIGSKINAYLNFGLLFNWHLSSDWNLKAGVAYTHCSNGDTHYPNYGSNVLSPRIGVVRTFGANQNNKHHRFIKKDIFKPYICYDLIIFGATRQKEIYSEQKEEKVTIPGSFGVIGLNFNPLYNINRYFRAGVSLDILYNESANLKDHIASDQVTEDVKFHRPPFIEQFSAGLSLRAEFVMPIFSINAGIGRNFICKGEETNCFYQLFAMKVHVSRSMFLHIGYQLYNFKEPNNLMLGIGYRFNSK